MLRSDITELGYALAREVAPGESSLQIHMRLILEEFTRKLADRLMALQEADRLCEKLDEDQPNLIPSWGTEPMTTNEAVQYIEETIVKNLEFLFQFRETDLQVRYHLDRLNLALRIVKADLKGGYQHYTGEHHKDI